jgi:hypothetical protein
LFASFAEEGIGRQKAFPTISVSLEESTQSNKHPSQRQTLPAVNKACEGGRMKLFRPNDVERKGILSKPDETLGDPRNQTLLVTKEGIFVTDRRTDALVFDCLLLPPSVHV